MIRFIAFLKKEFYHILRDYRTLMILIGMPVVQLLIFGFVITNEIKDAKIAIMDHAKDERSREITDKLLSSGYFILEENLSSVKNMDDIFQKGRIKLLVVYEPGFSRQLEREGKSHVQLIADASDPNTAKLLVNYASGIIGDYVQKEFAGANLPVKITPEVRMRYNQRLEGAYMYVPGTMAMILMLISAMMTSISIVREKEFGSMEVLLVSPLRPIQIIMGKVAPYILLSFVNAITIILLGLFVFGLPVHGSMIILLAESILFITLALSVGIFISTVSNTQQVAMFVSMFALMLPTILLSGFIFPIENMPLPLQWLSAIMPPRWFIVIIKNVMLKGAGIGYIWKETLILAGITVLFILLSIKRFKTRLE
jgi:ABC-2 type transport system permease protein